MGSSCCTSCDEGKGCASSSGLSELAPIFTSARDAEAAFLVGGESFLLCPGVPRKVAWRLSVPNLVQTASEAYELGTCNAVRVSIVVLGYISGSSALAIEGSLDKSNWKSLGGVAVILTGLGYRSTNFSGVTDRFVRIRHTGGTAINDRNFILATTLTGSRS